MIGCTVLATDVTVAAPVSESCGCCLDAARFPGSGEPPCPSCGHTVKDCNDK